MENQTPIEMIDLEIPEGISLYLRELELMKQEISRLMGIPIEREGAFQGMARACRPS